MVIYCRALNLYRITSDWNEEITCWNNQPSLAPQPTTNAIVPSSYGWMSWDVTNDIQSFIDGTNPDYGWEIKDDNYWGQSNIPVMVFRTKEYGSYIPYLEIEIANVYVDDNADPSWYDATHVKTIQEGIDNATTGDTVFVYSGTYNPQFLIPEYAYLYIEKSINLIGENKDTTIVNCPDMGNTGGESGILVGWHGYAVVSDVTISGFTFHGGHNSGSIGIYVQPHGSDIRVENCIVDSFADGVSLVDVTNCLVRNCTFYDNSREGGIDINGGANANHIIKDCTSYSNSYGIHVEEVNSCIIYHNNLYSNTVNAYETTSSNIIWYNTELNEGNYYGDYTGDDNNGDGIGDTPYNIAGGSNQDLYPFMSLNGWLIPPNIPPVANFIYTPDNPTNTSVIHFTDTSYDLDGSIVSWWWDFGDHYFSNLQNPVHCYYQDGSYNITLTVTDNQGSTNTSQQTIVVFSNNAPNTPKKPSGPKRGVINKTYRYSTNTTDPEGDQVYYFWDWGDGTNSGWLGPYNSGTTVTASHKWTAIGMYNVKVKAKDVYGKESDWSPALSVFILK